MTLNNDLKEFNDLIIDLLEDEELSSNGSVFNVVYAWSQIRDRLIKQDTVKV